MPRTKNPIQVLIDELDEELEERRELVLGLASKISGHKVNVHSLHGTIGGKNNLYVDAVREEFSDPEEFYSSWLHGLKTRIEDDKAKRKRWARSGFPTTPSAAIHIGTLLKVPEIEEYARLYFERNFYRNYKERTRFKPDEELWSLWFGDNKQPWGLLLAPVFRFGEWTNDKSEMRRADFEYWTVGHVLSTGLVVPDKKDVMEFDSFKAFRQFYGTVLQRASNSTYEQPIAERYLDYLEGSADVEAEPLLIPEIRYEGKAVKHRYRLDFSILNSHTQEFTGFEISPASTHMNVNDIAAKDLTKVAANEDVKKQWEGEMAKRNDYFSKFGITTITFTDTSLKDIDACFEDIAEKLRARQPDKKSIASELQEIRDLV